MDPSKVTFMEKVIQVLLDMQLVNFPSHCVYDYSSRQERKEKEKKKTFYI